MVRLAIESALNRPVWSARTTGDARCRRRVAGAPFSLPNIAPFSGDGGGSPEAFAALRELPCGRRARRLVKLNMPSVIRV